MKTLTGFMAALFLVLLPLAIYQPSLTGGFLWDDDAHVTHNETIQDPTALSRIWFEPGAVPQYYPMAHTGFWLQYQLWGDWSTGYRLVNASLHGICALLVWLILCRLGVPGAWVAAAIFAVHPLHVETVAWISELKNLLSGMFYLLALYAWLFFAGPLDQPAAARRRWWLYGLCMVLFALALLSKTVTATLPAVLFLLVWWKRPRLKMVDVIPLIPMFVLGLTLGLVTVYYEKHFVGAQGADFDFSPIDRFLIAGRALWFYATKLLWPHPLIFFYPRWVIDPTMLVQYLYPLGALAVMGFLFVFRSNLGKGALVAVLFFAGTLMPALGFFDVYPFVYSFVANHFAYLASLGVIVLVVGAAATFANRCGNAGTWAGRVLGAIVILLLCGVTWHECQAYVSSEALYKDVIAKNPRAWMAQNNLANLYISLDRWDEAADYATRSLKVNPENDRARKTMAVVYVHQGQREKAIEQYGRSLNINPHDPRTHVSLAALLLEEGRVDLAMKYLQIAISLDSESAKTYNVLGHAWLQKGDATEAMANFKKAQGLDEQLPDATAGMAQVLEFQNRPAAAIKMYQESLKLLDDQPQLHNNLATLLAKQGKAASAIEHYRLALKYDPSFLVARQNLAKTLAHLGKSKDAAAEYVLVLEVDPTNIEALNAIADAHVGANELAQAQAGYEKVLKLDPLNAYAHNNLGVVYMTLNEDLKAAKHIENAIKISPQLVDAWFNLGLLNLKHSRLVPAEKSFAQVLKLAPDNGGAYFQLGWTHELQNKEAQAVAAYRSALELMPKSPQVKNRLAWMLATSIIPSLRSPQEAVALALEAAKQTKRVDIGVLDTLGVAHASAGQYKEAIGVAKRAVKLAQESGQEDRAQIILQRIALYKANQPYVPLPGAPVPPVTPVPPAAPAASDKPAVPVKPVAPAKPVKPAAPAAPAKPATPATQPAPVVAP